VRIRRNPRFTTTPSWSKFDAAESIVSFTTTGVVTEGNIVTTIVIPGGGSIQVSLQEYDVNMNTGDVYAITVQSLKASSSAANTHVSLNWAELQ